MAHLSVSDIAVIAEWLGLDQEPLPGARCFMITRTYVTAFVHQHLRPGRGTPPLDACVLEWRHD